MKYTRILVTILLVILLAIPLLSIAPAPPAVYRVQLAIVRSAPVTQACTWETAPARLRQQIEDPIGYPYGMVEAWSCSGDAQAVIAELQTRVDAMQSEAAAYRAAHPIKGLK
jgi:hypothetical protein